MPVAVLRMRPEHVEGGRVENWVPQPHNSTVVGYFGVRHFDQQGNISGTGITGIWQDRSMTNDTKNVAVIQAAAKCYEVFCRRALEGRSRGVPWPKAAGFKTLNTNYPYLSLLKKMLSITAAVRGTRIEFKPGDMTHWETGMKAHHSGLMFVHGEHAFFLAQGQALQQLCEDLASQVVSVPTGAGLRVSYGVQVSQQEVTAGKRDAMDGSKCTISIEDVTVLIRMGECEKALDGLCAYAQAMWKETNEPVVTAVQQAIFAEQTRQSRITVRVGGISTAVSDQGSVSWRHEPYPQSFPRRPEGKSPLKVRSSYPQPAPVRRSNTHQYGAVPLTPQHFNLNARPSTSSRPYVHNESSDSVPDDDGEGCAVNPYEAPTSTPHGRSQHDRHNP